MSCTILVVAGPAAKASCRSATRGEFGCNQVVLIESAYVSRLEQYADGVDEIPKHEVALAGVAVNVCRNYRRIVRMFRYQLRRFTCSAAIWAFAT
jgi:hypothetical protein